MARNLGYPPIAEPLDTHETRDVAWWQPTAEPVRLRRRALAGLVAMPLDVSPTATVEWWRPASEPVRPPRRPPMPDHVWWPFESSVLQPEEDVPFVTVFYPGVVRITYAPTASGQKT